MRYGRRAARKPSGPTGATSQEEKTKAGMTFPPLREKQLCVCTNFLHFSMPLQLSHCAKMPVLLQDSRNPFLVFHAFKTISQWIMKKTLFPFQVQANCVDGFFVSFSLSSLNHPPTVNPSTGSWVPKGLRTVHAVGLPCLLERIRVRGCL